MIPIQKSKLTRRRAADSTDSTARRGNEVRLFFWIGMMHGISNQGVRDKKGALLKKHLPKGHSGAVKVFPRKIILNKPYLILFSHALVTAQFLLHIPKTAFQKIGGFGDVQFSKALKGKQIIQVPFQAVVGTAKPLVRVV